MSWLRIRSQLLHVALLAALCSWCALAAAQQGGAAGSSASNTGNSSSEAGKGSTPPAKPAPAKSKDSFTPSEEVSEDLSVSFPVDI